MSITTDVSLRASLRVIFCVPHPAVSSLLPHGGVPRMQKLMAPNGGSEGYRRFPLSKPVVGRNIALHAVSAYRASTYLVSAFPAHSTSFFLNVFKPSTVECVLSSEPECLLVVGAHFCFALI